MRRRSKLILAGAAVAAFPAVSGAAITLTLGIDPAMFQYSTTAAGPFSSSVPAGYTATYSSGTNTLTISDGTTNAPLYFEMALTGNLTTAVSGTRTATGLSDFYVGMSNTNPAVAQPDPGGTGTGVILDTNIVPTFAGLLSSNSNAGDTTAVNNGAGLVKGDGGGGISLSSGAMGGAFTITQNTTTLATNKATFDANTTTDLVSGIEMDTGLNSGSSPLSTALAFLQDKGATVYTYTWINGTKTEYASEAFSSDSSTSVVVPDRKSVV